MLVKRAFFLLGIKIIFDKPRSFVVPALARELGGAIAVGVGRVFGKRQKQANAFEASAVGGGQ